MTFDTSLSNAKFPIAVLVDGGSQIPRFYKDSVVQAGFHVVVATNPDEAVQQLQREDVDLVLADAQSMDFIGFVRGKYPGINVVVLTHMGTVESAVEAMRLGVIDFFAEPFELTGFEEKLESLANAAKLERTRMTFIQQSASLVQSGRLIGECSNMREVQRSIEKASTHDCPVLILGESGTGKELVARSIHNLGNRANAAFIPVDCASLTPTLIESELFGHEKGAFTGAFLQKMGMFQAADNGTLFLDEIGELPRELQAKLLRVLQEKAVRRVGSTEFRPINVRIIAATNRDLSCAVKAKEFREDLFYRLNVVQLHLPPLRERKSDIPLLVAAFIEKHKHESRPIERVANISWSSLLAHSWPGNVRELENTIESALALGSGPILHTADLNPDDILWNGASGRLANYRYELDAADSLGEIERKAIFAVLAETQGDKQAAALRLGIGKTTLYRKLREYESAAHASA